RPRARSRLRRPLPDPRQPAGGGRQPRGCHRRGLFGAGPKQLRDHRDQPPPRAVGGRLRANRRERPPRRRPGALLLRSVPRRARSPDRDRGTLMGARILLIDDDAGIRESMRMPLEYEGYEYSSAASAEEGIAAITRESPDIVFLDIKMPGM